MNQQSGRASNEPTIGPANNRRTILSDFIQAPSVPKAIARIKCLEKRQDSRRAHTFLGALAVVRRRRYPTKLPRTIKVLLTPLGPDTLVLTRRAGYGGHVFQDPQLPLNMLRILIFQP
jgi:hypothetical protein